MSEAKTYFFDDFLLDLKYSFSFITGQGLNRENRENLPNLFKLCENIYFFSLSVLFGYFIKFSNNRLDYYSDEEENLLVPFCSVLHPGPVQRAA